MNKVYLAIRTPLYNAVIEKFDILNENALKHTAHSIKSSINSKKIELFNNFSTAQKYSTNSKIDNNYATSVVLDALSKSIGFKSHAHYIQQQKSVIQTLKNKYNLRKYVTAFNQSHGIENSSHSFYEIDFHQLSGQTIFNIGICTQYINSKDLENFSNNKNPIIKLLFNFHHLPGIDYIEYDEDKCLNDAKKILEMILLSNNNELSLNDNSYTKIDIINYLYEELSRKLDLSLTNHISTYAFFKSHDSQCYKTLVPFSEIHINFIKNNEYHHISNYSDDKIKTSKAVFDVFITILHALYQEFIKQEEITVHTLQDNNRIVIFNKQNGEYCILVKNQISELLPRRDRITGLPFNELPYCIQEEYHYEYWRLFEYSKPVYYETAPSYYQLRDTLPQSNSQYFNETNNEKQFHIENKGYEPLRPPKHLRFLDIYPDLTHQNINNVVFHKTSVLGKTLWISDLISHNNFSKFIDENPNFFNERNPKADKLVIHKMHNENIEIQDDFIHNHNPYREKIDAISVTWFDVVKYLKWFEECSFQPFRLLMPSEFYELRIRGHKDTWLSKDEFIQLKSQEQNLNADDLSQHDQEYFHHQYRALKHDITKDGIRFHTDVDEAEWLGNFKLIRTKLMSEIGGTWSLAQRLANDPQHPILPDTFLNPPQEISCHNNGHDFGFKTYFRLCFEEPIS